MQEVNLRVQVGRHQNRFQSRRVWSGSTEVQLLNVLQESPSPSSNPLNLAPLLALSTLTPASLVFCLFASIDKCSSSGLDLLSCIPHHSMSQHHHRAHHVMRDHVISIILFFLLSSNDGPVHNCLPLSLVSSHSVFLHICCGSTSISFLESSPAFKHINKIARKSQESARAIPG